MRMSPYPFSFYPMSMVLGINAYHGNASAALVIDGQLIAAVEEDCFNRIKHSADIPAESIHWCLEACDVKAADVDHVAISFDPRAGAERANHEESNAPPMTSDRRKTPHGGE